MATQAAGTDPEQGWGRNGTGDEEGAVDMAAWGSRGWSLRCCGLGVRRSARRFKCFTSATARGEQVGRDTCITEAHHYFAVHRACITKRPCQRRRHAATAGGEPGRGRFGSGGLLCLRPARARGEARAVYNHG